MANQVAPIICYLLAGIAGAWGQYFYKLGSARLGQVAIVENWQLLAGVVSFSIVMVFFVLGFKWGGRLSVVYPFYATTFIWAALIAQKFADEVLTPLMWVGIILICLGVALVAGGSMVKS